MRCTVIIGLCAIYSWGIKEEVGEVFIKEVVFDLCFEFRLGGFYKAEEVLCVKVWRYGLFWGLYLVWYDREGGCL